MSIVHIVIIAIILAISIGLHEYAHALVSHRLGDPTPKLQNRLTPNPLAHIDWIGFLMIFLIGFGWGKPVQVNPYYYKKPVQWELLVALAWPATNIALAFAGICVMLIYSSIMWYQLTDVMDNTNDLVLVFWFLFSNLNIALAIFNMLPIRPLDGFRLVKTFLPRVARWIEQYNYYISIVLLILLLGPGRSVIGWFISSVAQSIFVVFYTIISTIIY